MNTFLKTGMRLFADAKEEVVSQEHIEEVATTHGYVAPALKLWTGCRCTKSHKNSGSWIKCRLNYYHDNGENKSKPTFNTSEVYRGKSPWVVLVKTYSGDYYTHHNGRARNHGYYRYEVWSFDTHREALNRYHQMSTENCLAHFEGLNRCYNTPCRFVESYIIQILDFQKA